DNFNLYQLKKEAIENSIYGVDIDIGAVEIAKLRLWLSLVVDKGFEFQQEKLLSEVWTFEDLDIKEKIEKIGTPLKDWDVNINYGIKTGFNEAFIIDEKTRQKILNNCKTEEEKKRTEAIIKPVLRGRDIKRYYYKWAGLYLIYIPWHFPLHKDKKINGVSMKAEYKFKKIYPSLYNYLFLYKDRLSKRNKAETNIRYEWYVLQRYASDYYDEFEKEKIVWTPVDSEYKFAYLPIEAYLLNSIFMITPKYEGNKFLKYLLAVLNSKLIRQYITLGTNLSREGVYAYGSKEKIEKLPIPKIPEEKQKPLIELVDKILELTNREDYEYRPDLQEKVQQYSKQIDQLVYKLYNLTDEEIKRIERKLKNDK
ncbi:MAG: hypothetical protein DSY60_04455, partial [Persephonella sp.]